MNRLKNKAINRFAVTSLVYDFYFHNWVPRASRNFAILFRCFYEVDSTDDVKSVVYGDFKRLETLSATSFRHYFMGKTSQCDSMNGKKRMQSGRDGAGAKSYRFARVRENLELC